METKGLNLSELLKGHEGEEFYTTVFGYAQFTRIRDYNDNFPIIMNDGGFSLSEEGKYHNDGECVLFPSKEQRDWNKWAIEQKPKVPKIWEDITHCNVEIWQAISHLDYGAVEPVVKSALALLKIHQLIEVGYGGNVTTDEWCGYAQNPIYVILPEYNEGDFLGIYPVDDLDDRGIHHIAFHTEKQAIEFMSYSENVQLIKDFYMIC